eukprot:SAG22_NODE_4967_length_1122_cov_1.779628_1_plen_77_part_01
MSHFHSSNRYITEKYRRLSGPCPPHSRARSRDGGGQPQGDDGQTSSEDQGTSEGTGGLPPPDRQADALVEGSAGGSE